MSDGGTSQMNPDKPEGNVKAFLGTQVGLDSFEYCWVPDPGMFIWEETLRQTQDTHWNTWEFSWRTQGRWVV